MSKIMETILHKFSKYISDIDTYVSTGHDFCRIFNKKTHKTMFKIYTKNGDVYTGKTRIGNIYDADFTT